MFKQIMGFDTDLLKFGVAVRVEDNEPTERPRGHIYCDLDGMEFKWENKTGNYLISESSSTVLRLINARGKEIKLHIRHFIGLQPRMTIKIMQSF